VKVIIIGAGMSGLCMGVKLQEQGIPFVILEKSPRLGGTWWENTYPGCACDIPSHLYSFSFAPKSDWSRVYPGQAEILGYLEQLARDRGLLGSIRFGAEVRQASYQEDEARWWVELADGEVLEGDVLVSAVGALHRPKLPALEGLGSFAGPSWHSARWNHSVDLRGKRVGVIGNAASAVQIVPEVAKQAIELFVFQRSAHWILPRWDRAYSERAKALFRLEPLRRLYRWAIYLRLELLFLLVFRLGSRPARWLRRQLVARLHGLVADPALRDALIPDYPLGCKRGLLSDDYYPALLRPNVRVVTDPLQEELVDGLRTDRQRYALDAIVYATGFDPMGVGPLRIHGREGVELTARWAESPQAHLGMTVPGFPNFYVLLGPNTGLGHNSVMWMVECQANYVARCLRLQRRRSLRALEVRQEALDAFYARLGRRMADKVWSACRSWYRRDDGLIFALWPSSTVRYWWETRRPRLADFEQRL
jgi:cation diffusion facilitator CzcD-associated flavoprotein CzcO